MMFKIRSLVPQGNRWRGGPMGRRGRERMLSFPCLKLTLCDGLESCLCDFPHRSEISFSFLATTTTKDGGKKAPFFCIFRKPRFYNPFNACFSKWLHFSKWLQPMMNNIAESWEWKGFGVLGLFSRFWKRMFCSPTWKLVFLPPAQLRSHPIQKCTVLLLCKEVMSLRINCYHTQPREWSKLGLDCWIHSG